MTIKRSFIATSNPWKIMRLLVTYFQNHNKNIQKSSSTPGSFVNGFLLICEHGYHKPELYKSMDSG